MINSERDVLEALQKTFTVAVATAGSYPVKYINATFNRPNDNKWWELIHLPNNPADSTWGNSKVYRGMFRMLLHWPNDGGGSYDAMDKAEAIIAYYNKNNKLGKGLQILNQPRLFNVLEADTELVLPVQLEYTSFSP